MLSEPQELTFTVPDFGQAESSHRLACYQWGNPGAARTVICVHGLTRNGRDFDFLARALSSDYRVLCPDLPGRGKSDWLKDGTGYSYPAYVADITAVLSRLNITRLHWVGTSMGGMLAMIMLNINPSLIDALVLNDIGCIVSATGLTRILEYAGKPVVFASRAAAEASLRERCAPFGISSEDQWQQLFAHSFQQTADGNIRFACDPGILAGVSKEDVAKDIDLWPLWETVTKIPVLLIRGARSDILTAQTAKEMQARHPRLTLTEIASAGHAPALMDDDQITLIRRWLNAADNTTV